VDVEGKVVVMFEQLAVDDDKRGEEEVNRGKDKSKGEEELLDDEGNEVYGVTTFIPLNENQVCRF